MEFLMSLTLTSFVKFALYVVMGAAAMLLTAILIRPDWGEVARGLIPSFPPGAARWGLGVLGGVGRHLRLRASKSDRDHAPNVTGVYGGRNVVVPTSGICASVRVASIASPVMFDVFPWSVPMPSVV